MCFIKAIEQKLSKDKCVPSSQNGLDLRDMRYVKAMDSMDQEEPEAENVKLFVEMSCPAESPGVDLELRKPIQLPQHELWKLMESAIGLESWELDSVLQVYFKTSEVVASEDGVPAECIQHANGKLLIRKGNGSIVYLNFKGLVRYTEME